MEEVYGLKKYVPLLSYLDMSDNPLAEDKSYRWLCVHVCACLVSACMCMYVCFLTFAKSPLPSLPGPPPFTR